MRIAIVGSRNYGDLEEVRRYVASLPVDTIVVSGGARGVDKTAEQTAKTCGLETKIFPAEWDKYGKSAGFRRNTVMVLAADRIVAFWDGKSAGTKHTIDMAIKYRKPLIVTTSGE